MLPNPMGIKKNLHKINRYLQGSDNLMFSILDSCIKITPCIKKFRIHEFSTRPGKIDTY